MQAETISHLGLDFQHVVFLLQLLLVLLSQSLGNVAEDAVIVYGFRVAYGGGKSTGFGSAYDSVDEAKKVEPTHRLVREGLGESRSKTRAAWKELKKKKRTTWGTGRRAQMHKKKRADRE